VIQGQGEVPLVRLLEVLLDNFFNYHNPDIDDYPFPDRDALPIQSYHYQVDGVPTTPIMTTRGCPFHCSFCGKIDGKFEIQSSKRTVAEFDFVHDKYGYDSFMIFDDVFVASKRRLQQMASIMGNKYKIRCFARSNLLDDDICEALVKLGVVEIGIGIESGSTEILKRNMKGTTRTMNTNAVKRLHKYGIRAKAFLIVGLPGETIETIMETADWIRSTKPDDVDISIFQPMPGSKIFNDPKRWGIRFEDDLAPGWYKGTPGKYQTVSRTAALSGRDIIKYRDMLENEFKRPELLK